MKTGYAVLMYIGDLQLKLETACQKLAGSHHTYSKTVI